MANNPYQTNNAYENKNNSYEQQNIDNNLQKMEKIRAKSEVKNAFDKIIKNHSDAQKNGIEYENNYEDIGKIRRYYYKYVFNNFIGLLIIIGLICSIASFFNKLVFFTPLLAPFIYTFFSKKLFSETLFYAQDVEKKAKKEIYKYIFNENNQIVFIAVSVLLTIITFVVHIFSKAIFLAEFEDEKIVQFLTNSFPSFDINNELFAYSILLSFISLIIFKIIKK